MHFDLVLQPQVGQKVLLVYLVGVLELLHHFVLVPDLSQFVLFDLLVLLANFVLVIHLRVVETHQFLLLLFLLDEGSLVLDALLFGVVESH